jgi:hypothetical protein
MERAVERVVSGVLWLLPIAAGFACVFFYLDDNPTKAIFWLLAAVLIKRWIDPVLARVRRFQSRAWHCEYCGQLTTVPHTRCQELKGPRPPVTAQ